MRDFKAGLRSTASYLTKKEHCYLNSSLQYILDDIDNHQIKFQANDLDRQIDNPVIYSLFYKGDAMVEALIVRVEQIERLLAELPLVSAAVEDDRVDGATDAAAMALRDLLDRITDVAVERYRRGDHRTA